MYTFRMCVDTSALFEYHIIDHAGEFEQDPSKGP